MKNIYPHTSELEYRYLLKLGLLFEFYPECTGIYEDDKELFRNPADTPDGVI